MDRYAITIREREREVTSLFGYRKGGSWICRETLGDTGSEHRDSVGTREERAPAGADVRRTRLDR